MLNIEEIKARVEKATPGPWRTSGDIEHLVCAEENSEKYSGPPIIADCGHLYNASNSFQVREMQDNAVFIAHARTDIPALIAEVERLNIVLQDERKEHSKGYARLRSTYINADTEKEKQIATLKKALELMTKYNDDQITNHYGECPSSMPVGNCKKHSGSCEDCLTDYFIQQVQEEKDNAK